MSGLRNMATGRATWRQRSCSGNRHCKVWQGLSSNLWPQSQKPIVSNLSHLQSRCSSHHLKPHSLFPFWKLSCWELAGDTALWTEGQCLTSLPQTGGGGNQTVGMWCKTGFPKLREQSSTSDMHTQVESKSQATKTYLTRSKHEDSL